MVHAADRADRLTTAEPAIEATDPAAGHPGGSTGMARASAADTLRVLGTVLVPIVARGVILRRRRVMALAERLDADRRAVALLRRLRARYGPGPLVLRIPGRTVALVLSPDHLRRVLEQAPEPFAPASRDKRGALGHFQPDGVLVSHGEARARRRAVNEAALDTASPEHRLAAAQVAVVGEEARRLLASKDVLTWADFEVAWWRMARRVVLGDGAADDERLTGQLAALRRAANWSYFRPQRRLLRRRFLRRLASHLARAEPGSLASLLAAAPQPAAPDATTAGATTHATTTRDLAAPDVAGPDAAVPAAPAAATADAATADPGTPDAAARPVAARDAAGQVPHWLFAFDAAGMATWQAAALLATNPEAAAWMSDEVAGRDLAVPQDLPYLRACVQDAVRLWPTTMVVLRDSTAETSWDGGTLPAGTTFAAVSAFFHRDPDVLAHADRFAPEAWLDADDGDTWPMVPFSAGPAACAGQNLVLLLASTMLARLFDGRELRLLPTQGRPALDWITGQRRSALDPDDPLPGTLDPFRLAFRVEPAT